MIKKILLTILLFSLTGCSNTVDLSAASDVSATALSNKYNQATEIKSKYQLLGTALKTIPKADPKDRIVVTVGSDEVLLGGAGEFEPSVKISRWDEVSLKLTPKGLDKIASKDKKVSFEGNKIKFETPKVDYKMYDLPASKDLEEGGYEYEVILKEKPTTNVVEFDIETQGLDFFYQPALANENPDGSTWEEADGDRSERPANINGSYSIYYENGKSGDFSATVGKKNYKAGKMGHIYRPKIIDAKGNWVWGEFNKDLQETKKLTVTVPQDFLDKAVYPVVVDPTLGYTTAGGTSSVLAGDTVRMSTPWTTAEGGTISAIVVYDFDTAASSPFRGVIYASSTLALIDVGAERDKEGVGLDWIGIPMDNQAITASTYYGLGVWMATANDFNTSRYDTATGFRLVRDDLVYHATNNPNDPFVADSYLSDRKYSFYAVYTCATGTCTDTYSEDGTYTWVAPTGVSSVDVACWGGGGSGGQFSGGAGGGGGGAYAASTGIAVTAGNSYAVVVGAGGGFHSSGDGFPGGDSSFNATTVVADGGKGGDSDGTQGAGGAVADSTGTVKYAGGDGGAFNSIPDTCGGGGGAGGPDGAGVAGQTGQATTGGNGGAGDNSSGGAGGAGGNGGAGSNGTDNALGGGGSGGGDTGKNSGYGGAPGGGSGGGGNLVYDGADGACTITYTISAPSAPSTNKQQIIIFD